MAMLLADTAKHFCQNKKILCFCRMNMINHSKGRNPILCPSICMIVRVFYLGPIPAPKHMEIYFEERKENIPDWTSWVILQLLYFSNAGALVEIRPQSSFSLSPVISLGYTDLDGRCLQKSRCLVMVTRSSHRKSECISIKETPGLRGEKVMQAIRRRLLQWFSVHLHLHHKPIIFPSTKGQQGCWQPAQPHGDRAGSADCAAEGALVMVRTLLPSLQHLAPDRAARLALLRVLKGFLSSQGGQANAV